jgi:membrane protein DedA with SNARE-associated domain
VHVALNDVVSLVIRHGYAMLAAAVFLEAIGIPVPAALALLIAGAAIAWGKLSPVIALPTTIAFMMLGDTCLFLLGRYTGWQLLGLLCRVSLNPETCILRSAESFHRRGRMTLLIAKFIPGINTMAPPLAGSMMMPIRQFWRWDLGGVTLYVLAWGSVGYFGSDFLTVMIRGVRTLGNVMEILVAIVVIGYVIYRLVLYWKHRAYRVVPRVLVAEVVRKLTENPEQVMIADVRSHGYYDAEAKRIKGSIRLEPNQLPDNLRDLARDREIYLYCT